MTATEVVVSDSSFYIAFLSQDEIGNCQLLLDLLEKYDFHAGPVVLEELSRRHALVIQQLNLAKFVTKETYDFSAL